MIMGASIISVIELLMVLSKLLLEVLWFEKTNRIKNSFLGM